MAITANMSLTTWPDLTDVFDHTALAANFDAIDTHDHTSSKGVKIGTGGLGNLTVGTAQLQATAVTTGKLADLGVTTSKINNFAITRGKMEVTIVEALHQVGDLKLSALSVAPSGWLLCDGSAVSRTGGTTALFAAIGVIYGVGNGTTTFNLPDLRGRVAVGAGTGSGLTARTNGASGGEESHALATGELPVHTHSLPWDQILTDFASGAGIGHFGGAGGSTSPPPDTTGSAGSGTAHNNMQPFQVVNFFIKT